MKFFLFLWELLQSIFSHPYERRPEYAEYIAYWRPKFRVQYAQGWGFVAGFLAFVSVMLISTGNLWLVGGLLASSMLIGFVAMARFEALLYNVSGGRTMPGSLTGITVLVCALGAAFGVRFGEYAVPASVLAMVSTAFAGSLMVCLGHIGGYRFKQAWQQYLDANPSRGYIDWDGRWHSTAPKVAWLRPVR